MTGSLRLRVTAAGVLVLTVALAAVVGIGLTLFQTASRHAVDGQLTDRVAVARQLARTAATPRQFFARVDGRSVRARLVLSDGTVYGPPESPTEDARARRTVDLTGARAWTRGARLTLEVDGRLLDRVESRLVWGMVVTGAVALLVTAGLLLVLVRVALAPLDAMTELARSIAGGNRGARLAPTRRDTELGRTAAAFDDMLDSLEGAEVRERGAQQAVRQFVADAAHELRTPVTGVQAVAETLLQADSDTPVEERERLTLLLIRETRRAGRLVDDMLDMARIDAGLTLTPVPTDLAVIADEQAQRVRLLHPELTITVSGTAPPALADPVRVAQVVANLLDNACQATPPGGDVRLVVESSPRDPTPGWVHLRVIDAGVGVPPDDAARVFERMVRLDDSRDRRSGGSGLGLAVARGLARLHGGDVVLVPTGPPGAEFRLDLPAAAPGSAPSPVP
ncbi:HAMP domain-containing sensor histidine kinase [Williamsia deligens]|uniref:histidine kinase n=1 Tax=Williamsia deligens TaxID=321325 RepID=A0ABW3G761_9NOCA|nr:HAMP domain-containing sensor histidine kinase [Williamsia deligens]MCP2193214.1 Signal transduction histidine kinase [Williamsia deligens]